MSASGRLHVNFRFRRLTREPATAAQPVASAREHSPLGGGGGGGTGIPRRPDAASESDVAVPARLVAVSRTRMVSSTSSSPSR